MDGEIDPDTLRERLAASEAAADPDGSHDEDGTDGVPEADEADGIDEADGTDERNSASDDGDAPLVVDIRSPADFAAGHLPGSLNVPLADLPGEIDRIAEADDVVTVCPHGKASVKAARIVGAYRDFDGRVVSLAGGLEAWDGPLESDDEYTDERTAPF